MAKRQMFTRFIGVSNKPMLDKIILNIQLCETVIAPSHIFLYATLKSFYVKRNLSRLKMYFLNNKSEDYQYPIVKNY